MADNLYTFNQARPKCLSKWQRNIPGGDVQVTFTKFKVHRSTTAFPGTPYKYTYTAVTAADWALLDDNHGSGYKYNSNIRNDYAFTRQG